MRIAVSGAGGLIGSALAESFRSDGHMVVRLVRERARVRPGESVFWDPARGEIDAAGLEGIDAVVHLAGESVAGRWTAQKRRRIWRSRVDGTTLLARALAGLSRPPAVLLHASGAHYYGGRGDERVDEGSPPGEGFMPELVQAWEAASEPAETAGIRVVRTRFGNVLAPRGGSLGIMLPVFRLGLGGRFGSGRQAWPWIALPDVVAGVRHLLGRHDAAGAYNFVAPDSVTNAEFTRTLARVLRRPAFFHVPAVALRAVFRDFADEALLVGAFIEPRRLLESGFVFQYPRLEPALRALLG